MLGHQKPTFAGVTHGITKGMFWPVIEILLGCPSTSGLHCLSGVHLAEAVLQRSTNLLGLTCYMCGCLVSRGALEWGSGQTMPRVATNMDVHSATCSQITQCCKVLKFQAWVIDIFCCPKVQVYLKHSIFGLAGGPTPLE